MKQALRLLSRVALIVPIGLTFGLWQAAPVAAASAPPSSTPGAR